MAHRTERALPVAAVVVTLAAILGGGFSPIQRLWLGLLLILVWTLAALEWRGRLQAPEFFMIGFVLWGSMVALVIRAAPLASKETVTVWIVAGALWSLARRGRPHTKRLALEVLACGGAVVAIAIVVVAGVEGSIRVGGLFENPNVAVAILVPTLPLGLIVFGGRMWWRRVSWFVLIGSAILLTGSRAGMLAAVVATGFLLPRGKVRLVGLVGGSGLAVAALVWRFMSQPDLLAWHRISIWWTVFKIWATRPLTGVGPGCLVEAAGAERILHPDQVGRYQFVISVAESTPLAVLVQLGVVGLVLAALVVGSWWWSVRRSEAGDATPLNSGLASVVTLALFHDFLTTDPVLWWWAVTLGCLEGVVWPSEHSSDRSNPQVVLRVAVALVLSWLTAWGIMTPALARLACSSGPVTRELIERAQRIEPWYSAPAGQRVQDLLFQRDPWSWETAAEGLYWAETALGAHPGLARRSADVAKVHMRILTDLGGTDHDAEAARDALDRACELDPHLPWHWLERARLERLLGQQQAAFGFVRRAISEEPNTVRAWLMLSRLELEQGRIVEAQTALEEAEVRANLIGRSGLTAYERELLAAPRDQMEFLERMLITNRAGRP